MSHHGKSAGGDGKGNDGGNHGGPPGHHQGSTGDKKSLRQILEELSRVVEEARELAEELQGAAKGSPRRISPLQTEGVELLDRFTEGLKNPDTESEIFNAVLRSGGAAKEKRDEIVAESNRMVTIKGKVRSMATGAWQANNMSIEGMAGLVEAYSKVNNELDALMRLAELIVNPDVLERVKKSIRNAQEELGKILSRYWRRDEPEGKFQPPGSGGPGGHGGHGGSGAGAALHA